MDFPTQYEELQISFFSGYFQSIWHFLHFPYQQYRKNSSFSCDFEAELRLGCSPTASVTGWDQEEQRVMIIALPGAVPEKNKK